MDYELRIVVEKVASSSQEVMKRDTITSYALQCPTSIVELGLRHAEHSHSAPPRMAIHVFCQRHVSHGQPTPTVICCLV
jgi:hypothetical protein